MAHDVFNLIEPGFSIDPEAPVVVTPQGESISYARYRRTIDVFCARLAANGVEAGNNVAVAIRNPAVTLAMIIAISRLGAVFVGGAGASQNLADHLRLDAVVQDRISPTSRVRQILFDGSWSPQINNVPTVPNLGLDGPDEIWAVLSSSGSTGTPKFMAFPLSLTRQRLDDNDLVHGTNHMRRLVTYGIQTPFGLEIALRTLRSGGMVMWPVESAAYTLDLMRKFAVEEMFCAPGVLGELANTQALSDRDLPALKSIIAGGSLLSDAHAQLVLKHLCPVLFNLYGSSELGPTARIRLGREELAPGTVGTPVSWIDVRMQSDGQIMLRAQGNRMPNGYLNPGGDGQSQFEDGWFIPGDTGYLDETGRLVITGRTSDVINTGGNKINASVIDALAEAVPGVFEACAVALPGDGGFDDIGVAYVAQDGFDEDELRNVLAAKFENTARIRLLRVVRINKNAGGKADRRHTKTLFENQVSEVEE